MEAYRITAIYERDVMPYLALSDNIKNKTTKAHLWFEEYMAGDESINVENDIMTLFNGSVSIINTALSGGECELGVYDKSEDFLLVTKFDNSIKDLEELVRFTKQRQEKKAEDEMKMMLNADKGNTNSAEEAGGEMDILFDAAYDKVQKDMDQLSVYMKEMLEAKKKTVDNWTYGAFLFIIVIIIMSCWRIYFSVLESENMHEQETLRHEEEKKNFNLLGAYVEEISNSNFDATVPQSIEKDPLAQALKAMNNKLKQSYAQEALRLWTSQGIAKVSEILRKDTENSEEVYVQLLSYIVNYMGINQAGLFMVCNAENEEPYLDMVASYAYNRARIAEKRIAWGKGYVGQCAIEGMPTYLTNLKSGYTHLTSGLGDATPSVLLVAPLKLNNEVFGVIELAAFTPLEQHKQEFIFKVNESLASFIKSNSVNEKTKRLLQQNHEMIQKQNEAEEELRQNIEELTATQSDFNRRDFENQNKVRQLSNEIVELKRELDLTKEQIKQQTLNL